MPGPFYCAYAATRARSDQVQAVRGTSPSTLQYMTYLHKTPREDIG